MSDRVAMTMRGGIEYAREKGLRHAWPGVGFMMVRISRHTVRARCGAGVRVLTVTEFDPDDDRSCGRCAPLAR